MEFLPTYIMRGRMQAIMAASSFALLSIILPPVSIVSSAAVALITLRRGASEGGYVLIGTCLASVLLDILFVGNFHFSMLYSTIMWVTVWLSAIILREGRHLFLAMEIVIVIAALAITSAYLYQPNLPEFWQAQLEMLWKPVFLHYNPDVPDAEISHFFAKVSHFMTGGIVLNYVIVALAGLFLGRAWQAKLYNSGGFKKEYLNLHGNNGLAIATLLLITIPLLVSEQLAEICLNIGIVLFMVYALVGTIIFHCAFATLKTKGLVLPFLYISIAVIPHASILAAVIGLADTWLNLRNKIPNQTSV